MPHIVHIVSAEGVDGLIQLAHISLGQGSEVSPLCPVDCKISNTFMPVCWTF